MRKYSVFLLTILAVILTGCTANKTKDGYKLNDEGAIVTPTPEREKGQTDVLGLTVPAMDTVRVGFVGLGMRGSDAVVRYTYVPGVKITAICDVEPDRVKASQEDLAKRGFPAAAGYSGSTEAFKQLCENPDVDLV